MDIEQRLAARCFARGSCQPANRHRVALIAIAYERELPACCRLSKPIVALWQRGKSSPLGNSPLQTQAGQCPFQAMDCSERATVVAHERRRMGDKNEMLSSGHRGHPVTT